MNFETSKKLFEEAQKYLPGGVDSPVRAYKAVGGSPPFIVRGQGSRLYDADGNEFIDYVCSWGPLILGHAPSQVVKALREAAGKGTSFGAPTALEVTLAKMISAALPSMEMLRFVNSGTEATMTALRLARAFTKRDKIIKFAGGYHGHADGLLVKAGSGLATLSLPDSPGVPESYARNTLVAPYNNSEAVAQLFKSNPGEIAAVIIEPVAANMGVVPPHPGFLERLRRLTSENGALIIFDEVITGFRLAYGGAQTVFGITPDLTCLGKIIGGGLPVGAYGGKREIMQMIAPSGPVYQAGTLSGNPLAMTAGIETLKALSQPGVYEHLEETSANLEEGIIEAAAKLKLKLSVARIASLLTIFFTEEKPTDWDSASKADTARFGKFFQQLLSQGIYWPPSQFEAAFVSLAHSDQDVEKTVKAIERALGS
ncbi:MAG: glutamate-1-semialdehyde 2,1-aminomutase [Chloroflexi bacterium]|nr:glutamate-1-semialdehyde 2,1-aminomutase [Chloroflexota bacterium]